MMKALIIKLGGWVLFLPLLFIQGVYAQQADSAANKVTDVADKIFIWKTRAVKNKGYILSLDYPYGLNKAHHDPHDYITLSVSKKNKIDQPFYISFTLPDKVNIVKGLWVGFGRYLPGEKLHFPGTNHLYHLHYGQHWTNNHTIAAIIWHGWLLSHKRKDSVNIYQKFMQDDQLFILFYEDAEMKKLAFPLVYFQKKYRDLLSTPAYSTRNPADTMLTAEERKDKKVFDNGSIPTSWKIAGISDPIRLKHFIKYFRYLVDHNDKKKIAQLLVYPLKSVIPECKNATQFIQNYNKVFGQDLKEVIDTAKLDELSRNYEGVWIGYGPDIMIRQSENRYKIFEISNTPFFEKNGLPEPGKK